MRRSLLRRLAALALLALPCSAAAQTSVSDDPRFTFEAVDAFPRREMGAVLKVRLLDAGRRPRQGAQILAATLDRSPDGEPRATAPVTVLPTLEYGVYAFKADLRTDGRYALTITARLWEEPRPITGAVLFTVAPPAPAQPVRPKRSEPRTR